MKTATLVKDNLNGFNGHAALYKMQPSHDGYEYVIASTASMFGLETYLFPSDQSGNVVDWGEMDGSLKGTSSHCECFQSIGYELQE